MRKVLAAMAVLVIVGSSASPALAEEAKPDGKALYASKCAMCHGADGVAKAMGKPSANFNDPAFAASVDEIVKITMEGKGKKMPKFEGKLTAEQAHAVAEHVKTLVPKK
jgi:cytochrome c6